MTIKQKQCLLLYLGYYTGNVDGAWGAKSIAATKAFQSANGIAADGNFGQATEKAILNAVANNKVKETEVKTTTTSKSGDFWDEIEYFEKNEFKCKCGGKYCNGFPVEMDEKLIKTADKVRKHFGKSMRVSSGIRCTRHNANVGGVSNSRHLSGKAMDFCVSGVSAAQVVAYVKTLSEIRYTYAIDGSYVHMDVL